MVYIIDDKRSRQCDYGWDDEKFSLFRETIIPIRDINDLFTYRDSLIEQDNVILFHESFLSSTDEQKHNEIESLKSELRGSISFLYVAYFSGSKNARFVDGHICMLPPEVLYDNLEIFVSNFEKGVIDFKYLAFGENYNVEETIRNRLLKIIDENIDGEVATIEKKILFAETKKDSIEHPFKSCDIARDWDIFPSDISDIELDGFVYKWLNEKRFDVIYIPLCFGNVFCDYLGLRLALHIRLTMTVNQNVPIFIYGVSSYKEVRNNECFDVLKLSGVYLINASNEVLIRYAKSEVKCLGIENELDHININIPSNIGNNHSLANRWAIIRWQNMLQWKNDTPTIPTHNLYQSLYFKYLVSLYGKRNRFKDNQKYPAKIDGIEGKTIVYIDDEYDKGWYNILRQIIESESKAHFLCFDKFDKRMSKEKQISRICEYIEDKDKDNDVNCYLLDLRLHEDDFSKESDLSGHVIAEYIKKRNKGNQIVVFTASNKIWNLKKELFKIGAIGYALKESPNSNYTRDESKQLFIDFSNAIRNACNLSYLKGLFNKQIQLKNVKNETSELDCIAELLSIDNGNNNPYILESILLTEIVFLEHYLETVNNLSLSKTGDGIAMNVELCKNGTNIHKLTNHLFVKREEIIKGHPNVVDVFYSSTPIETPSLWSSVSKSDATLAISSLLLYYKFPLEKVRQYINLKLIRNTIVAHNGERNEIMYSKYQSQLIITVDKLKDFYYDIIVPVVLNEKNEF